MWLLGSKSQSSVRVLLATEPSLQASENANAFVLTTVLLTRPNDTSGVGRCSGFILVTVVKCPDHNNAEKRRACFSLRFQATYRPSQLGRHRGRDLKSLPFQGHIISTVKSRETIKTSLLASSQIPPLLYYWESLPGEWYGPQ